MEFEVIRSNRKTMAIEIIDGEERSVMGNSYTVYLVLCCAHLSYFETQSFSSQHRI